VQPGGPRQVTEKQASAAPGGATHTGVVRRGDQEQAAGSLRVVEAKRAGQPATGADTAAMAPGVPAPANELAEGAVLVAAEGPDVTTPQDESAAQQETGAVLDRSGLSRLLVDGLGDYPVEMSSFSHVELDLEAFGRRNQRLVELLNAEAQGDDAQRDREDAASDEDYTDQTPVFPTAGRDGGEPPEDGG